MANGEVAAAAGDLAVERDAAFVVFALEGEEAGGAERVVEDGVVVLPEGVEILAEGTAQELRLREMGC